MQKHFSFIYPVTRPQEGLNKIGGQLYEHVADLIVKGVASLSKAGGNFTNRCRMTISEILLEGNNLYPHIDGIESLDNIKAACANHAQQLFTVPQSDSHQYDQPQGAEIPFAMAFTS